MSSIKDRDTKPEMIVRKIVHSLGYRYRLHRKDLPGKPDLVFPRFKKVIFVHGCFWHKHMCRYGRVTPKTNAEFWSTKRESNKLRDIRNRKLLKEMGLGSLIIWECWTRNSKKSIEDKLKMYLQS
ncbi:MAG: DNA mismatch endonuclease Vsr [Bacteroidetes bacterium]|nr:MAG: DNA mismatch endonuclease Vsr [Bacteroidota bacterium]